MSSVRIIDYAALGESVNFSSDDISEERANIVLGQPQSDHDIRSTDRQGQLQASQPYPISNSPQVQSLFYSPKWISVLQQMYGFAIFTAIDESKGLRLHFALVDNMMGKKLVSLPFSDYTDIDNDQSADYRELVEALKGKFPETPIIFKTTGQNQKTEKDAVFGRITRNALYHRIPTGVRASSTANRELNEDVHSGTKANREVKIKTNIQPTAKTNTKLKINDFQSSSFQRNVRKAKKIGTTVAIKRDKTALNDFYTMYHGLRLNKFGSIPQPFSFFETIFEEFVAKNEGFMLEASYEDKPIASIMVLQHESVLYYKFGASTEESLDLRPNNLIFDQLISYAFDNEFEAIDLGLSGIGDSYEGLVRFKESMGGQPTPITYYQLDNSAKNNDRNTAVKKWLGGLTDQIVAIQPSPMDTSALSETIYPLFA